MKASEASTRSLRVGRIVVDGGRGVAVLTAAETSLLGCSDAVALNPAEKIVASSLTDVVAPKSTGKAAVPNASGVVAVCHAGSVVVRAENQLTVWPRRGVAVLTAAETSLLGCSDAVALNPAEKIVASSLTDVVGPKSTGKAAVPNTSGVVVVCYAVVAGRPADELVVDGGRGVAVISAPESSLLSASTQPGSVSRTKGGFLCPKLGRSQGRKSIALVAADAVAVCPGHRVASQAVRAVVGASRELRVPPLQIQLRSRGMELPV